MGSLSQESTHPWGSPRGPPGGSGLVQLRPERHEGKAGQTRVRRAKNPREEKGVKENARVGVGSPSKEGN